MKMAPDCDNCLRGLINQAANLATDDALLQRRAIRKATKIVEEEFSYDQISIVIATKIHEVIKEVTRNPDPYKAMKEREIVIARELYHEVKSLYTSDFEGYLKLAAAANAIDFFREPGLIEEDMRSPVRFVVDDSKHLESKLKNAGRVLYLADNAGEIYFDLILLEWMRQFARVTYVVKPLPVQNDVTLEDIKWAGLEREFGKVIDTGVASPGIILSLASTEFMQEFASADLIFAKGMGYYESLSELPREGKFCYCLKAKCKPVADSLGAPVNSYIAMLW